MKAVARLLVLILIIVPLTYATGTWTTIDVPGSTHTAAYRINSSGQIVGFYDDSNYAAHGFLFSNGSFTTIDFPGATATYALGINDSGTIVGLYGFKQQPLHGFVFDGTIFTTIDYPGALDTTVWDINDAGDVVGTYTDAITFDQIGFELTGGTYLTIQPPGTKRVSAYGINNAGDIVGVASFRGFVYSRGKYRQALNFPQATFTTLNDLDDSQKVVGQASTRLGEVKGFGYDHGIFEGLVFPKVVFTQAWGIGTHGEIVGLYVDGNGREHGFLFTGGGNH